VITTQPVRSSGTRRRVKAACFCVCWIICLPLIAVAWLEKRLSRGEALFILCAQSVAVLPGFAGRWIRGAYYFGALDHCSWETHIGFGSLFTHRGASIGPRVSMGAYCVIGHAQIGSDVMIGSRVSIPSGKRQHLDEEGRLADVMRFDRVMIGSQCWIGEGAIIMAAVGERSIVSAGAVVSRDVPPGSLVAGNPAAVIREIRHAASAPGGG
jgi:acetyltransferase-like isoleucine patch superfamily enzyme